jgi:hypothetical protein
MCSGRNTPGKSTTDGSGKSGRSGGSMGGVRVSRLGAREEQG